MKDIKLFLFDLDGTLISTGGAGVRALARVFEKLYGVKDATKKMDPSGKTDPVIFRELAAAHLQRDLDPAEMEKIYRQYLRILGKEMETAPHVRVLTGVIEFLDYLMGRGDVVIGLGTGNIEQGARIKLMRTPLNPYFPFGGFGSDSEDRVEVLKWGHKRAEAQCGRIIPESSVYIVGDTKRDIVAARGAGFNVLSVASGHTSYDDLRAHKPDYLVHHMGEGIELFKGVK